MSEHQPLTIEGYKPQPQSQVDKININKQAEELDLRVLDTLKNDPTVDQRWLAIGRTHLEQAWMAINRAIFQPTRVSLPKDNS